MTQNERKALAELKINKSIVIKKVDKINGMDVMDMNFYRDKFVLKDHLNQLTYETTSNDIDKKVFKNA